MATDIDNIVYKHISLAAMCIVPETIDNGRISNLYSFEYSDDLGFHFSLQDPYRYFDMNIICDSGYAANGLPMCQPDHS